MALSNNTFCWNGIVTTDIAKTLAFFPEVLGWKQQDMEMGGHKVSMLTNAGRPLAHIRTPEEGEPSWWNNYLRVDDVDAAAAKVAAAGGKIVVEPTDIAPGRFSTIATPSGAHMTLWKEANADDADAPTGVGELHWVDLHSTDIAKDLAFIHEALGMKTQEMPMPTGPYHILEPESATRAGAMAGQNPQAPSAWVAWIQVESVDDTLGRVERSGGNVLAPAWDAEGIGRMAIVSDPVGVTFGVITPPSQS